MKRNGPKRTISTGCGLELLQMVSDLDTGRCVSEDTRLPKRWIAGCGNLSLEDVF